MSYGIHLACVVKTPLLIPSFSSKGFEVNQRTKLSEVSDAFKMTAEALANAMLVSAYDIYYKLLPPIEAIAHVTDLTFLDSGAYEVPDAHDVSVRSSSGQTAQTWDAKRLAEVWAAWPRDSAAVLVGFDHKNLPMADQIERARESLGSHTDQLSAVVLKPETKDQAYVKDSSVIACVDQLGFFDVIGFAEKELGSSLLQRMARIARIRKALDDAGIPAPIHIFGSLDPITCCLFFLAGAELFDGLTWLRYSYTNGLAIYVPNYGAMAVGVAERDSLIRARALVDNVYYLRRLEDQMRVFVLDGKYESFSDHSRLLQHAQDLLRTCLGKGGV